MYTRINNSNAIQLVEQCETIIEAPKIERSIFLVTPGISFVNSNSIIIPKNISATSCLIGIEDQLIKSGMDKNNNPEKKLGKFGKILLDRVYTIIVIRLNNIGIKNLKIN